LVKEIHLLEKSKARNLISSFCAGGVKEPVEVRRMQIHQGD
jgi:hypothetical protein